MPVLDLIQVRRGDAADWTTADPTLSEGEFGYEADTGRVKIGDGATAWSSLPYHLRSTDLPNGVIMLWSGSIASIPDGWALCDGSGGTPDLRDRFVVGAGTTYAVDATGGAATHTHAAGTYAAATATTGITVAAHLVTTVSQSTADVQCLRNTSNHTVTDAGHGHTISGSSASGSSLPPYYALAYIMRTGS